MPQFCVQNFGHHLISCTWFYLLVACREGQEMSTQQYWLYTIRARYGGELNERRIFIHVF